MANETALHPMFLGFSPFLLCLQEIRLSWLFLSTAAQRHNFSLHFLFRKNTSNSLALQNKEKIRMEHIDSVLEIKNWCLLSCLFTTF